MLTIGRSVVQDPLDEHQGSHVKKQQDKEEQLREEFKEQAGVPLEIPKTRPQRDVMIECASLIIEKSFRGTLSTRIRIDASARYDSASKQSAIHSFTITSTRNTYTILTTLMHTPKIMCTTPNMIDSFILNEF